MSDDGVPTAGWYADPNDSNRERWWDGVAWTSTERASSPKRTTPWVPIVSLVLGVASLVFVWVLVVGAILALAGLILGIIGIQRSKALAISGIVASAASLAIFALVLASVLSSIS